MMWPFPTCIFKLGPREEHVVLPAGAWIPLIPVGTRLRCVFHCTFISQLRATWHRFTPFLPVMNDKAMRAARCKNSVCAAELSQRSHLCRSCVWQRASVCWFVWVGPKKRWEGRGGGGDDRCPCEAWARSWHLWPLFRLGLLQPGGPSTGQKTTSGANRISILAVKKGGGRDHKWLKYAL